MYLLVFIRFYAIMDLEVVNSVVFSPTGTTDRILDAIMSGMKYLLERNLNVTIEPAAEGMVDRNTLTVFAAPVYGGHVAPLALERMSRIRGDNAPAIVVVVYGNRDFENAAVEFANFVKERGFNVIGAAAFIGEHSYSSDEYPIAKGRPDKSDLLKAQEFGLRIYAKTGLRDEEPVDVSLLPRPDRSVTSYARFIAGVMKSKLKHTPVQKSALVADPDLCTHCGICASMCPTGAIEAGHEEMTDATKCIHCCACVKNCLEKIRVFETPYAKLLSENFKERQEPVFIL